jgi:hypothetical protein
LIASKEQELHSEIDEREGMIRGLLEKLLPKDWEDKGVIERRDYYDSDLGQKEPVDGTIRQIVCVAEIWCEFLSNTKANMTRYNTRDLNNIMRRLKGWEQPRSTKRFKLYGTQKYYRRKKIC